MAESLGKRNIYIVRKFNAKENDTELTRGHVFVLLVIKHVLTL